MKRLAISFACAALLLSTASAYNPAAYGDSVFELSSPKNLSGMNSVAGNPDLGFGPDSIVINPALPAEEQRVMLNAGYTALISGDSLNDKNDFGHFGSTAQLGLLIPFPMFNLSCYMNGTFAPMWEMYLKDSVTLKAGLSKQITQKLNVGANADAGIMWGAGNSWALGAGLGFVYDWGKLAFMKDFRFGGSFLNLGKYYETDDLYTYDGCKTASYPSWFTLKTGAAATFFQNQNIKFDASLDLTFPTFQNLIMDMGCQLGIKNQFFVTVSEKLNFREMADYNVAGSKRSNLIPAFGFFYKFNFSVKNNAFLEKKAWNENEMTVGAAYKNLYESVHAVSTGVDINLGQKDTTAPTIGVWDED